MKLNKILIICLTILIIAVAINTVEAVHIDDYSSTLNSDASNQLTHTYKATGKSVYIQDYNPKYKLSKKAKLQEKKIKDVPKKTYKITINEDTYNSLKNAKKTKNYKEYTFNTNIKCKVLKPVLKSKIVKKTIINKKYTNLQKYNNAYNKYYLKYNMNDNYNMKVNFHFYKGTHNIKYATIKITKKVKQVKIIKFKTGYTNIKANIFYTPNNGEFTRGSHLLFYGNTFGKDFSNFVASKHNFI